MKPLWFQIRSTEETMNHRLPELAFSYDALEPYIDAATMEIHHSKHHGGYVAKLNAALESYPDFQNKGVEELLKGLGSLPEGLRTAVRNNGGGHANHTLFWNLLKKNGGAEPAGDLAEAMNRTFGGFQQFKAEFAKAAMGRFGSGWAWLVLGNDGKMAISSTPNQDSPLSEGAGILMGLDVWEHAYYLKYQNRRNDYIDAFWNVVNWSAVADRYDRLK